MPSVTLATKVYNSFQLRLMKNSLQTTFKGLDFRIAGITASPRGRVQIEFSSQDEIFILNYLDANFELNPSEAKDIQKFATVNGRVSDLRKSRTELRVDIGVSLPAAVDAYIPLSMLQAQLLDGRKSPLQIICSLFGMCDSVPLDVKIANVDLGKNSIQAELSEKQLDLYRSWTGVLLHKLILLGATFEEVKSAIRIAGLVRDIVSIEPLAPFDQMITCKLGTDAKGVIPKIGGRLRRAAFCVFNPERIIEFFGDEKAILAK